MLQGAERAASLAGTVVKIAQQKRSARLSQVDLWDLVKRDCPREHKAYWAGPYCSAPAVAGLLRVEGFEKFHLGWWGGPQEGNWREVGKLRELIEREGVLFWDRYEDTEWRLVDTRWISAHRDIYNWLSSVSTGSRSLRWEGGHRCRACAMVENSMVNELKPLDLPYGDELARRLAGCLIHDRCKPYFTEWYTIAAKYSSEKEASAADAAAGRRSRYVKIEQAARLEPAAPAAAGAQESPESPWQESPWPTS
jgi:hypothetical protein